MNIFDLTGKKAVITGGTGLGRGMAEGLCEAGAHLVIIGISGRGAATAEELSRKYGVRVSAVRADLGCRQSLKAGFEKSVELLGGTLDILVNNAGITRRHKCEDFPIQDWEAVIEVDLTAVFILTQLAGKIMLEKGSGKIINIASMASYFGGQTIPAYAAAKSGIAGLTRAFSNEWAGRGVNVNAIAPGYMDTPLNTALINNSERNRQILDRIPMGRWGTPEDMKGTVVFLSSKASDYISGAVITVDGGYLGK